MTLGTDRFFICLIQRVKDNQCAGQELARERSLTSNGENWLAIGVAARTAKKCDQAGCQ
jgi:hypothetical protein